MNRLTVALVIGLCSHTEAMELPLKISAGGSSVDAVVTDLDGQFFVRPADLLSLKRFQLSPGQRQSQLEPITTFASRVEFDELNSELKLTIRPEFLRPQIIGDSPDFFLASEPIPAVLVSYDLRGESVAGKTNIGGIVEAIAHLGQLKLEVGGVASTETKPAINELRVVHEDLNASKAIEVGTVSGGSGLRSQRVSMLGFTYRKDLTISGVAFGPQLRVDGVATSPTTIDLLMQNQSRSVPVEEGPFSVIARPMIEGGTATVVVRDELGMPRVITSTLFANPALLGEGQDSWSTSMGGINYSGLRTHGMLAQGFYRAGLTNNFTGEMGYEITAGNFRQDFRRISLAGDLSTAVGDASLSIKSGWEGDHAINATVSKSKYLLGYRFSATAAAAIASKHFYQAGGTQLPSFSRSASVLAAGENISAYLTRVEATGGRIVSVGATKVFQSRVTISVGASEFRNSAGKRIASGFASLSIPIGRLSTSTSANVSSSGVSRRLSVYGTEGSTGYAVTAGGRNFDSLQASAFSHLESADTQIFASKTTAGSTLRVGATGALVSYAGKILPMRQPNSSDGFAVVDLGVPDLKIYSGFGKVLATDADGYAAFSIPSHTKAFLQLDPQTAPDTMDISPAEVVAGRQAGVLVRRRAEKFSGQFVSVPVTDGSIEIHGVLYPVTARGVWLELQPGEYTARAAGKELTLTIR